MATYRRISWGSGVITAEKLNTMVENSDYLYERMLRGNYDHMFLQKDSNLKINAMTCGFPNHINNVSRYMHAYWAKPFAPGCSPIIATSHYFTEKIIVSVGIRNINGGPFPDNAGFRVEAYAGDEGYGSEWAGEHWIGVVALGW